MGCSTLAGIIFTGRLNSATLKTGVGFELDAIAYCFIGGASTLGGVGTVVGAIVGGRFRMTVHDIEAIKPAKAMPNLPVACAMWEPTPDMMTGNEA